MTVAHGGLIIVIVGTVAVAFAVKFENKWTLSARTKDDRKEAEDIVKRAQDGTYLEPTVVLVNKWWFYGGLTAISLGTLMQW
jgi:hypothetical protein